MKKLMSVSVVSLLLMSPAVQAGIVDSFIDPCKDKVLGVLSMSRADRVAAVESQVNEEIDEIKQYRRFMKYDVNEVVSVLRKDFSASEAALATELLQLREAFNTTGKIQVSDGNSMTDLVAMEYLRVQLSRLKSFYKAGAYLDEVSKELQHAKEHSQKLEARMAVLQALVVTKPSQDIFDNACIVFKETETFKVNFPFDSQESLRSAALDQVSIISDEVLVQFVSEGELPIAGDADLVTTLSDWAAKAMTLFYK